MTIELVLSTGPAEEMTVSAVRILLRRGHSH